MRSVAVTVISLVWLVACSGKDAEPVDWSRKALVETKRTVAGLAFSINLPAGLDEVSDAMSVTWTAPGSAAGAPRVRVELVDTPAPRNLARAVEQALATSEYRTVYHKDNTSHGHLVVLHDEGKTAIAALTFRPAQKTRTLTCTAQVTGVGDGSKNSRNSQNFQIQASWIANLCKTLAFRDR